MPRKPKPPTRDPNKPVLSWYQNGTLNEILIAGPKDYIRCTHNPKHSWSPNSLIHRQWNASGHKDHELELWDPNLWGWLGRLIANQKLDADVALLTRSDSPEWDREHTEKRNWIVSRTGMFRERMEKTIQDAFGKEEPNEPHT